MHLVSDNLIVQLDTRIQVWWLSNLVYFVSNTCLFPLYFSHLKKKKIFMKISNSINSYLIALKVINFLSILELSLIIFSSYSFSFPLYYSKDANIAFATQCHQLYLRAQVRSPSFVLGFSVVNLRGLIPVVLAPVTPHVLYWLCTLLYDSGAWGHAATNNDLNVQQTHYTANHSYYLKKDKQLDGK